jgi:hypothetical protein
MAWTLWTPPPKKKNNNMPPIWGVHLVTFSLKMLLKNGKRHSSFKNIFHYILSKIKLKHKKAIGNQNMVKNKIEESKSCLEFNIRDLMTHPRFVT